MAHPKPPNPSYKEIIEEVVQTAHMHIDNAMQDQQNLLDDRLGLVTSDLHQQVGKPSSHMDKEK